MKIEIKSFSVRNFKGIKNLGVDFSDHITNFYGDNGTGKSSVVDSINWLWFGKDVNDNTKFSIKPLDTDNKTNPKIETDVIAVYLIDGFEIQIRRKLREIWTTRRGSTEEYLKGNETILEWGEGNSVSASEFETKRSEVIDQKIFKITTNPLFFNSLPWEKQREMLVSMAGDVSKMEILNNTPDDRKEFVERLLNSGDDIEILNNKLKTKIKRIKDEISFLPGRIDEANLAKPEILNWPEIEEKIRINKHKIESIQKQINDKSKALTTFNESRIDQQKELNEKRISLDNKEFELRTNFNTNKRNIEIDLNDSIENLSSLNKKLLNFENQIEDSQNDEQDLIKQKDKLLKTYKELRAEQFELNENDTICPSCKQKLPKAGEEVESLRTDFNSNKINQLNRMKEKGDEFNKQIQEQQARQVDIQKVIDEDRKNIPLLEELIKRSKDDLNLLGSFNTLNDVDYVALKKEFDIDKATFDAVEGPSVDNEGLNKELNSLLTNNRDLESNLFTKKSVERADERLKLINEELKAKNEALAELEKGQFAIESYEKSKISILEEKINSHFSDIRFKLFEKQINGGEKPICKALINGVPFSDANTAAKINAGLNVINVFSMYFNFYSPIFIDNRESITELIPVKSQVINLFKDESYKILTVEKL